jgi:hypothetical protein
MGQSPAKATAKKKWAFSERKARESRNLYLPTCYLALDLLQLPLLLLQLHSELLLLFARGWRCPLSFLQNASTPGGSVSDPSTEIARQVHSADVRVRVLFPLGFAFFLVLALLAGWLLDQVVWGAPLFLPFAVFAPALLRSSLHCPGVEAMTRTRFLAAGAPGDGR